MTTEGTITLTLSKADVTDVLSALVSSAELAKQSRDKAADSDMAAHDQAIIDRSARLIERVLNGVADEFGPGSALALVIVYARRWNTTVGEPPSYANEKATEKPEPEADDSATTDGPATAKQSGPKFRIGDRVRVISRGLDGGPPVGTSGTVIEDRSLVPYVRWDNWNEGHMGPAEAPGYDPNASDVWAVMQEKLEAV